MSFSGKKYRRVRAENVEELIKETHSNENIARALQSTAIFSFTKAGEDKFHFYLQAEDRCMKSTITLGVVTQMERRDGSKVEVVYNLEGDNVLKQVITTPEGKVSYFRREFSDTQTVLTISAKGTDVQAKVYYERVKD